jgi:hypothetical protein
VGVPVGLVGGGLLVLLGPLTPTGHARANARAHAWHAKGMDVTRVRACRAHTTPTLKKQPREPKAKTQQP